MIRIIEALCAIKDRYFFGEEFYDSFKIRSEYVEVFLNPSLKEVKEMFGEFICLRGVVILEDYPSQHLKVGDWLVWSGYAIHGDLTDRYLGIIQTGEVLHSSKIINVYIDNNLKITLSDMYLRYLGGRYPDPGQYEDEKEYIRGIVDDLVYYMRDPFIPIAPTNDLETWLDLKAV